MALFGAEKVKIARHTSASHPRPWKYWNVPVGGGSEDVRRYKMISAVPFIITLRRSERKYNQHQKHRWGEQLKAVCGVSNYLLNEGIEVSSYLLLHLEKQWVTARGCFHFCFFTYLLDKPSLSSPNLTSKWRQPKLPCQPHWYGSKVFFIFFLLVLLPETLNPSVIPCISSNDGTRVLTPVLQAKI